ncbi:invasion associated locus B family protein [Phaeovulum sp.]|uniref:invasion associated locus B family protein n=1 Tax=Phaeovulum sp. TaxID=2934796 RepID=UPI0039E60C04
MIVDLTKPLVIALALGLATSAFAQEATTPPATDTTTTETPATDATAADTTATDAPADLSLGTTADAPDGVGTTYTAETFGDWKLQCIRTQDGNDPCQIYQILKDAQGGSVADISIFALPAGQKAAAGATIVTPLETLLTQQVTLQIDTAPAKVYPFTFCNTTGCFSRIGFTQADVDGFKKGKKAMLTVVPAVAPDQKVEMTLSLSGFTAAYDAVTKANADNK